MNKPEYHQSRLKLYSRCPASFKMAMSDIMPDIPKTTQATMDEGSLFEGYVLGFKENKKEDELYGSKREATKEKLKTQLMIQANHIRPLFLHPENSYVKLRHETSEYILAGEADNIGELDWDYLNKFTGEKYNKTEKSINDLKKTGSIGFVWAGLDKKINYLQAIMYVYINYKNTREILPFIYIIIEDTYNKPIIKIKKIFIQDTDFIWLETFINEVHNDLFYYPSTGFESCEGGRGKGRCWFLEQCQAGRNYIGGQERIDFNSLI